MTSRITVQPGETLQDALKRTRAERFHVETEDAARKIVEWFHATSHEPASFEVEVAHVRQILRAAVQDTVSLEVAGPEPGAPIGEVGCPGCGIHLEIVHGEDEGIAAYCDIDIPAARKPRLNLGRGQHHENHLEDCP